MAEYISKFSAVDKLIRLENEFQHYKPFSPKESAMYRRICETEIEIGKMQSADVAMVRRWIPVTERMPESEGTYLVYTNRGSVYASHFYEKKVFRDDYVREPQWSQRGKVEVTHWMPLPEPPKDT